MPLDEERGKRITPDLIKWLLELRSIGSSMTVRAAYRTDDDLVFMALCFVAKQLDHIESMRRLVPSKDTGLIARTILEGMTQLYWAYEDPVRASRWRAFAIVEEWELMPVWESDGMDVSAHRDAIQDAIEQFKHLIYTKKALAAEEAGTDIPDRPFHPNWRGGVPVSEILQRPENREFKARFYGPLSAWVHWSSGAFADRLRPTGEGMAFESESFAHSASALVLAVYTTWECLLLLAGLLGNETAIIELEDFRERFEQWLDDPKSHRPLEVS